MKIPIIITIIILIIFGILIFFAVKLGNERQLWLSEHCEEIGKISGSSGFGNTISANGTIGYGTVYISGKTGYKCDDGKEYWE